ncbi:glutaredoxin 3 [Methyloligella sp. 2.7D]|uniref:glutaredoxin 3 n=1 Tax=unclassified Methyloligella TaxID=2625955 RepID=UPI00157C2C7D|nr:glutaredoxin 3 [Methyloligella sp. GL2]QKP76599.1 glutaredoxin 3 [Methyloligella sp. GL2]
MSRITLYTTQLCGYCRAAKQLLMSKGLEFEEIAVDWDPDLRQEMMSRASGSHTVPQIFFGDLHIGGYQDLAALDRAGKLDATLAGAEEMEPMSAEAASKA